MRIHGKYLGHETQFETDRTKQGLVMLNLQHACITAIDLTTHTTRARRLGLPQDSRKALVPLRGRKPSPGKSPPVCAPWPDSALSPLTSTKT